MNVIAPDILQDWLLHKKKINLKVGDKLKIWTMWYNITHESYNSKTKPKVFTMLKTKTIIYRIIVI